MIELIVDFLNESGCKWAQVQTRDLIFRDEFIEKCAMNYCGRYKKSWTCPPAIGDVKTHIDHFLRYSQAILFSQVFPLEDPYDVEGMDAGRKVIMEKTYALLDLAKKNHWDVDFLAAGSCSICEKCTYPSDRCRFPEKALISMEALGIDVASLARKYGQKYYNGPLTTTYFAMIFFYEEPPCHK